jgi:hypothetical protein
MVLEMKRYAIYLCEWWGKESKRRNIVQAALLYRLYSIYTLKNAAWKCRDERLTRVARPSSLEHYFGTPYPVLHRELR